MFVVYDTETTGLWKNAYELEDPRQPKIAQLSALLCEESGQIIDEVNLLVKPDGWTVDPGAEAIHGLSDEHLKANGLPLEDVLREFDLLVRESDYAVGYNLAFDDHVVRHCLKTIKRRIALPRSVCAMMMAKDVLQIPSEFKEGDFKWPKLTQAYEFFFNKPMENAHDASVDTRGTLEIYVEMKKRGVKDAPPAMVRKNMKVTDFEEEHRNLSSLKERVRSALTKMNDLSQWERTFVTDLHGRCERFGDNVRMSEKQWLILERLTEDVNDGGDPLPPF